MKIRPAAIKAAQKKLRFRSDKSINDSLDYFCGDFAEAYRVGAAEAQGEIVNRLMELAK